jgi:hypothetical protein
VPDTGRHPLAEPQFGRSAESKVVEGQEISRGTKMELLGLTT